ncbi:TonB-dependent receptor [Chryseobacterium sp. NEB161]|nr:TonB-dependent receptor [Chryseobacterium sp. NEB161]
MKMLSKRPALVLMLTMSTASFYFAQSSKDTLSSEKKIDEVVVVGRNLTQVAKERKTPVAISTIKAADIQDRLGNREFPEIAKSTPSVYVTKVGGGYGDGRINIRGFDAINIAVLINGQPVNDMEGGTVYWSNWTGLADIASSIQIQRGLGASKLVVPSVGGTFNVVTKATEAKRGGLFKVDAANNYYGKLTAGYSTGLSKSGWATTVLLSRWQGDGYVNGTSGEGYSWFLSSGVKLGDKHAINFTATGAPQVHDTRRAFATNAPAVTIGSLMKYGRRYNPQTGLLNGRDFNVAPNFYNKPIASINWDWDINDKLKLSTVVYGSWGRGGGGTGLNGSIKNAANQTMDYINDGAGGDGTINWDMIYRYNQGLAVKDYNGNTFQKNNTVMNYGGTNGIVRRQGVNSHNWYGAISDLTYKPSAHWSINGGIDLKTYKGLHYDIITDFLGSSAVQVGKSLNYPSGFVIDQAVKPEPITKLKDNQKVSYDNDGLVKWGGIYGQVEYSNEKLSAFLQGSVSQQSYKRVDRFAYAPGNQETDWHTKTGYILKTGANYNIDEHHNVFFNVGKISRQPLFNAIYPNNKNDFYNAHNEGILSFELGYGFKSRFVDVNVNGYRTHWTDRFITRGFTANANDAANFPGVIEKGSYSYNAIGLGQLHQGVELEAKARPFSNLRLRGMLSIGNWKYDGNADFSIIDNGTLQEVPGAKGKINVDGLKVGDAAQTTAGLGAEFNFTKAFSIDANFEYYENLYAQFNPTNFLTQAARDKGVVKLPSYNLFDLGASYVWNFNKTDALKFRLNVFNVFNTYYISELTSNVQATDVIGNGNTQTYQQAGRTWKGIADANNGFYGFGRTWSATITYKF